MRIKEIIAAATVVSLAALPLQAQAQAAAPGAAAAPAGASSAEAGTRAWRIDRSHSDVTFRVRHLVSRVPGSFDRWTATLNADPGSWDESSVTVQIETASINTRHEKRDGHLRSDDFFDAENHPVITFASRKVTAEGDRLRIEGDLTIRGVTRPVVLDGEIVALNAGADGSYRAGFSARTTINRHDFGVSWNRAAEGGGLVLADDVEIEVNLAAVAPAQ